MDVGKFAKAYVAQKKIDYKYMGKDYGDADALDYVDCTYVEYNGNSVSILIFSCLVGDSIFHLITVSLFQLFKLTVLCKAGVFFSRRS